MVRLRRIASNCQCKNGIVEKKTWKRDKLSGIRIKPSKCNNILCTCTSRSRFDFVLLLLAFSFFLINSQKRVHLLFIYCLFSLCVCVFFFMSWKCICIWFELCYYIRLHANRLQKINGNKWNFFGMRMRRKMFLTHRNACELVNTEKKNGKCVFVLYMLTELRKKKQWKHFHRWTGCGKLFE